LITSGIFAKIIFDLPITIHTKDLVKTYSSRTVVNHVSIDVKQGEIVGLLGPNGAGKTTTFYMVVGLIKPDEGEVFLDTEEITKLPMYKRAQLGIGYLPQEASVFRKLSVEDNILAVLEMTNLSKREQKEKLEALLDEFRLHHVRKNNGDSLSGGERRRTEIARALAVDPKFMLLDEPFAGVDPIAVEDIQTVVARLKHKNIGILITDHNVNETLSICDRAYLLIEGKIFKHGTAEELADDEQVRKLYLGRNFELKRKDYLHEEASRQINGEEIKLNNLIRVVDYCLNQTIIILDGVRNEPKIKALIADYHGSWDGSFPEDWQLDEYVKSLNETKAALFKYADQTNDKELKQRVAQIPLVESKDYKPAIWDIADGNAGGVIDVIQLIGFEDKLEELKNNLEEIYSILQNPAWKEVYK
jgi:lipopolysaccharide export system ATP-binding protein